ncbi:hypothetical protein FRC10_008374 [Ceratobasidium sp. 414]|nr:hypothetical protein FRC10_008374 [Ceratobasidium sp. 414]
MSCPIDVRFWQPPEEIHMVHTPPPSIQAATEKTKHHVRRWRSLDISFWCVHCMRDIMAFLGSLPEPIELDSLTIGPMGNATLSWPDEAFLTIPEHLVSQRELNIQPAVLRMDSYPIDCLAISLSARLTTMVILSEPIEESVNINMENALYHRWGSILCSTPNLVSLTLWHSCPRGTFLDSVPEGWAEDSVPLLSLQYLNLSNRYVELCLLLACSPLPNLKNLTIDSSDGKNVPLYVGKLAAVAPLLSSLAISYPGKPHASSQPWHEAFQKLQSLQQLTLSEMEESAATGILTLGNLPETLSNVWLERISFRWSIAWPPLHLTSDNPPTLSFLGYDDVLKINSDGAHRLICRDDLKKPNRRDKYGRSVFHSRETDIYMEEDLAIVRGRIPRSTSPSDLASEIDASDEERNMNDGCNSEMDTSSEVSFASGDLYVIELGQQGSNTNDE